MLALLERPLARRARRKISKRIFGEALPANSRLWSKEGDTSEVRHDAAYVELPDGKKFIVVILTRAQQTTRRSFLLSESHYSPKLIGRSHLNTPCINLSVYAA